jgi:NLR family CARD domain-containing protein 3
LIKNSVLTSIELDYNSIGNIGCLAMAAMLLQNTLLTKISLKGNGIGPAGAIALAETLRMNSSLRELGLARNGIGNEGAAAMATALKFNTTLERLDLGFNSISGKEAMAILNTLKFYNHALTSLDLKGNYMWPGLRKALLAVTYNARVFNCLIKNLRNPLGETIIPLVVQALHLNTKKPWFLARRIPAVAGFTFYLVRMAASNDSKAVKFPPSADHGW